MSAQKYKILNKFDIIQEGDEYSYDGIIWKKLESIYFLRQTRIYDFSYKFRRPIKIRKKIMG